MILIRLLILMITAQKKDSNDENRFCSQRRRPRPPGAAEVRRRLPRRSRPRPPSGSVLGGKSCCVPDLCPLPAAPWRITALPMDEKGGCKSGFRIGRCKRPHDAAVANTMRRGGGRTGTNRRCSLGFVSSQRGWLLLRGPRRPLPVLLQRFTAVDKNQLQFSESRISFHLSWCCQWDNHGGDALSYIKRILLYKLYKNLLLYKKNNINNNKRWHEHHLQQQQQYWWW